MNFNTESRFLSRFWALRKRKFNRALGKQEPRNQEKQRTILDSKSASNLLDIMAKLNLKENMTFIFSTHDPRVIERARRVITLVDGKIFSDSAQVSTKHSSDPYTLHVP